MSQLHLYNTHSRSIEAFQPITPGKAGVYSCGPTVYSRHHLGNLRPYVLADLLTRVLRLSGLAVTHVINITDVGHLTDDGDDGDDKLELAARNSGSAALEVARIWSELFQRDLELLDVQPPTVWARATEHIAEQIEMIGKLEAKGFTYRTRDGVYFDTSKDPGYGALSRLRTTGVHSRLDLRGRGDKKRPADFALWKLSPSDGPRRQLEWQSPWGTGFPGWHIECSAMASKYLGERIDIHTGGVDHIAVHHTNEIAQSENAHGSKPWVNVWMHGAWLELDGEKISKSRSHEREPPNLDHLAHLGVTPAGFRYYLYTAHYRSPLSLSGEALRGAEAARRRLRAIVRAGSDAEASFGLRSPALEALREKFRLALLDDLDAPRAISVLWEIADQHEPLPLRARLIRELGDSIGLALSSRAPVTDDDALIEALVARRNAAREARDFALSDALRAELTAKGVVLEDAPTGSTWRRA
jgi:cysteinyl-tRNA synthetase